MVVFEKLNDKGSMLLDSLFGLAVCAICCSLLLPLYSKMMHTESRQQAQLHASQVMYSAAHYVKHRQQIDGVQTIDGREYRWSYNGTTLCVHYFFDEQEAELCASKTNEDSH